MGEKSYSLIYSVKKKKAFALGFIYLFFFVISLLNQATMGAAVNVYALD
jgi:hypothetical protein